MARHRLEQLVHGRLERVGAPHRGDEPIRGGDDHRDVAVGGQALDVRDLDVQHVARHDALGHVLERASESGQRCRARAGELDGETGHLPREDRPPAPDFEPVRTFAPAGAAREGVSAPADRLEEGA